MTTPSFPKLSVRRPVGTWKPSPNDDRRSPVAARQHSFRRLPNRNASDCSTSRRGDGQQLTSQIEYRHSRQEIVIDRANRVIVGTDARHEHRHGQLPFIGPTDSDRELTRRRRLNRKGSGCSPPRRLDLKKHQTGRRLVRDDLANCRESVPHRDVSH
jgi:hypothetical protein